MEMTADLYLPLTSNLMETVDQSLAKGAFIEVCILKSLFFPIFKKIQCQVIVDSVPVISWGVYISKAR